MRTYVCVMSRVPPPSPTVDVWSAACILAEMITNQVLFQGHDSILSHSDCNKAYLFIFTIYMIIKQNNK